MAHSIVFDHFFVCLTSKLNCQYLQRNSGLTPLDFAIEKQSAEPDNDLRTDMVDLLLSRGVRLLLLLLLLRSILVNFAYLCNSGAQHAARLRLEQ
jgi:hypothetical protein